jgi:hypothetical protein
MIEDKVKRYAIMVEGKQTPSKLYDDYESAEVEAKRLASQEKKTTYVLLAVAKYELNDVKKTEL